MSAKKASVQPYIFFFMFCKKNGLVLYYEANDVKMKDR